MLKLNSAARALCLLAFAWTAPAVAQTPVKIGIGFGFAFLPMYIADELDLVEKNAKADGLTVAASYERFSGSAAMGDAVLSGSVDMGVYGVPAILIAWDKAAKTPQQVFGIAGVNSSPLTLVTNKSDAKSISDLAAGDKIAMPALVSPQMFVLQMIAEKTFGSGQHDKLKPQVAALPHPEALNAILTGGTEVRAYFSSPPFTQIALQSGKARSIATSNDAFGGRSSFLVLGATKRYIDANPKMASVMIKAIAEASDLIRKDPKRAAEIYLKAEPQKTLDRAKVEDMLKGMGEDFGTEVYGVKTLSDFMGRIGTLKNVPSGFKDVFVPELHQTKSN
jgi:NitT/TauT family transport system substrate-binding protein